MFNKVVTKIFGTKHERDVKRINPTVREINEVYETLHSLSDFELRAKTTEFKERLKEGETVDEILPEAFAVVKEVCRRLVEREASWYVCGIKTDWNMIPFDVQLVGAVVIHQGKVAEMSTGEGKTLVATMPAYLNALSGKGVHIVTVNDYLALRDSEWMGEIYRFLGLSVGCIQHDMDNEERKEQYLCDITYGTNNEFGFDYLRDNMTFRPESRVQRGFNFAIVDEADSILIDEARTPLIISGPVAVADRTGELLKLKPLVEKVVKTQNRLVRDFVQEGKKLLNEGREEEAAEKLLVAHRGAPKDEQLLELYKEKGMRKLVTDTELACLRDKRLPEIDDQLYFVVEEKEHSVYFQEKGRSLFSSGGPKTTFERSSAEEEQQDRYRDPFEIPDLESEFERIEADRSLEPEEKYKRRKEVESLYYELTERSHYINQLLKAYCLFKEDVDYIIAGDDGERGKSGRVIIVDQFTGRPLPGRRFSEGLHQAIEAKHYGRVKIERETQTYATITLQNYFRMYEKISGMTGTAESEAAELYEIYKFDVVKIPTNRPVRRIDYDDVIYRTRKEKYAAIVEEAMSVHGQGRPVLIGTTSVEVSELIAHMLRSKGIKGTVVNAGQMEQAAAKQIEATSRKGWGEYYKEVQRELRELHEKMQSEPEEDKKNYFREKIENLKYQVSTKDRRYQRRKGQIMGEWESMIVAEAGFESAVTIATNMAGRGTDIKLGPEVVKHPHCRLVAPWEDGENCPYLDELNCYENVPCGLHIIGTERHESRRIDLQLRGRSARQGDPGSSCFFISLEDDLMRLFGSERIAVVMDRLGVKEGEVIQHPMITRAIERAQKRVEAQNFAIRKRLLEYDNVMNRQREVIYDRRTAALEGENLREEVQEMIEKVLTKQIDTYCPSDGEPGEWDLQGLSFQLSRIFKVFVTFSREDVPRLTREGLLEQFAGLARQTYDGLERELTSEKMRERERAYMLQALDYYWKSHLYEMDELKAGAGLRAYGQRDPLVEYKRETFEIFTEMLDKIDETVVFNIFNTAAPDDSRPGVARKAKEPQLVEVKESGLSLLSADQTSTAPKRERKAPVKAGPKVGRNDPCPCGSGKKYKKCCGA
jgi:preprotein translocase subunit SecA